MMKQNENKAPNRKYESKERKYYAPLNIRPGDVKNLKKITGADKGIQGNINSCYLDTLLMAMFPFTSVFDYLLYREKDSKDIEEYKNMQEMLKNSIVKPIRK
jgi:hypothetical protein